MPSIYNLKPRFQDLLRPLVRKLAAMSVTANQVTIAAALLSFFAGGLVVAWPQQRQLLFLIPLVLFVRMALNAVDGMLAREHDMKTALGAILNELGDVLADAALYLPLALVSGVSAVLIVMIVLLSVIVEMAGVVAVQIGASRRYDGPMGKSDRAFVFGLLALLLGLDVPTAAWLDTALIVVVLLLFLTLWNRARRALAEV